MGPKTPDPGLGYEAHWLCAPRSRGYSGWIFSARHVEYFLVQRAYLQPRPIYYSQIYL